MNLSSLIQLIFYPTPLNLSRLSKIAINILHAVLIHLCMFTFVEMVKEVPFVLVSDMIDDGQPLFSKKFWLLVTVLTTIPQMVSHTPNPCMQLKATMTISFLQQFLSDAFFDVVRIKLVCNIWKIGSQQFGY